MKFLQIGILSLFLMSCATGSKTSENFEKRVESQTAESLSQVERNLKDLLSMHTELTEQQKKEISSRLRLFIGTQRSLREREQKLLEIGLGDAIYASEASLGHWKKEVNKLYEQKAENIRSTVSDIHNITKDPPVKKDFYHEFPFLMREVR